MTLVRVTPPLWQHIEASWQQECAAVGEDFAEFAPQYVAHARGVAHEDPQDRRYGIYVYRHDDRFPALMHANSAMLPGTQGKTLRVVWVLLSPRYDYADTDLAELATIASGVISGAVELARSPAMRSQHIKVHMGNAFDRSLFASVGALLRVSQGVEMALRGNWAHLDNLGAP